MTGTLGRNRGVETRNVQSPLQHQLRTRHMLTISATSAALTCLWAGTAAHAGKCANQSQLWSFVRAGEELKVFTVRLPSDSSSSLERIGNSGNKPAYQFPEGFRGRKTL